ncbi:YdiU family protein [Pueribacillus theae]|uniref:Protein nucleotidyltransferase YdiU n=1 Tax=Pueribacillus theae TaxID=2171751 RepID=A0A2U1K6N2_9BACI|nr:YdiU family protein [Pueribacillus theae]PWA12905.1 YdiU family protein [Pueribacillus theae]
MNKNMSEAGWNFDNSYIRLPKTFFVSQRPNPVTSPKLKVLNKPLAKSLGLNVQALERADGAAVFAGNEIPDGSSPLAQAYAGHQFGNFTMLGDGRAILLGEQITPSGERFDIQLKGAGKTPFSRGGDGRAALGPMLREYIISEAMHALGIPTTRSLAVVTTGEEIIRETKLPGAILTRVAASHLRVGTFEYAAQWGKEDELQKLADYAINRHFPDIETAEDKYLLLLYRVIERQAELISKWQLVGFIHGVMNTDNMAISGETIDYGPCAFMDTYDPATVFSSIDVQGRYAYGNQPGIGQWNLARFAETLLPLLHDEQDEAIKLAQEALSDYADKFDNHMQAGFKKKLGLFGEEEQDEAFIKELLGLMEKHKADFTNTFRALALEKLDANASLFSSAAFQGWYKKWQERLDRQQKTKADAQELMKKSNPAVIPRNHRVEEALEAAVEQDDYGVMERLLKALANPYAYSLEQEEYAAPPKPSSYPYRTYCGT